MRTEVIDELDPFDAFDAEVVNELDGFHVVEFVEDGEAHLPEEDPFCPGGAGDDEGLCVKTRWGCSYIGCPLVDNG